MKVFDIKIRRDAHTITPVQVPEHEVAILQTVFGEENVLNRDGKSLAEHGLTDADVAGDVEFGQDEFERLARKYGGSDEGLFVEQVYGKKAGKGLEHAMSAQKSGGKAKGGRRGAGQHVDGESAE